MHTLLPLFFIFLTRTNGAGASDPTMPFMVYLDQDHMVCLKWGFHDLQEEITFKLTVNTTGWVGFGLSPNGDMKGADIVIGGHGPDGPYFTDRHGEGKFMPIVDTQQSYTLISLSESEGQTTMTFNRAFQTCDDKDYHITAQPIKLIYAYGTTDEIAYHGARRGTKEVNLLKYMSRTSPPKVNYLSATVVNITVPALHTYYHCKVMTFPNLTTKHHVYLIEPVIENHDIVHHILLYSCPSLVNETYDRKCYIHDIGDACFTVVAAWGAGGGITTLPEDVGIPFGGGDRDTHYRLEIHYNNPHLESGRTDSSGLRLYYTDKLRKIDAGIMTTGVIPFESIDYKIPPKAPQFFSYGVCNTTLFPQFVNPVPDLHVFGVELHTHLAGRKVRVGHYRKGEQIDFLALDENYDFEYQQFILLGNIKTIKPGDEILVECTYSTFNRSKDTMMGLATTDEMCLAFLFYYPAIDISSCVSSPNTDYVGNATDQMPLSEYQKLMNNVPQIEVVTDGNFNLTLFENGIIRDIMETPTVICDTASSTACIINPTRIILLLLWIALM